MNGHSWRRRSVIVAAVPLLLLTACASIPTSGPVEQRGEIRTERDDPFVRVLAKGPSEGMSPEAILKGFLRASASFDDSHAIARSFLTREAAAGWDSGSGAVVYQEDPAEELLSRKGNVLNLVGNEVATLSERGELTAADGATTVDAEFGLRKTDGEWRIDRLPNGLFLTPLDVDRSYRSFNLYFLDPTSTRLVPNAVLIPVGPLASTTLVADLLKGPTDWLRPAARTAFPEGTGLTVPSAPIQDGVAQVDLDGSALLASAEDRLAMSAQLVWTLRQLPDVSAVRVTVDGVPLPGVSVEQPRDAWPEFSPDGPSTGDAYLARDGRLLRLSGAELDVVPGAMGDGRVPASNPAVSLDGQFLAALSPSREILYVTRTGLASPVRSRLTGSDLTPPSWDATGSVWTAGWTGSRTTVWAIDAEADGVRRVRAPALKGRQVVALRVAKDGVRVALVVERPGASHALYLARIERGQTLQLTGLRRVEAALVDVTDVVWADADRLAVIGQEPNGVPQPLIVEPNGTVTRAAGSLSELVRLAAAPGRPLLAATSDGTLWVDTDAGWQSIGQGADPAYPG